MKNSKKKVVREDVLELLNGVLSAFRAVEMPLAVKDVAAAMGLEPRIVQLAIEHLQDQGYDLKRIVAGQEVKWSLIRYGQNKMEQYYRSQGEIETPTILTADWHAASYGFSGIALKKMANDITEYGIKSVVHAGDFYQGRGVHKMELEDCITLDVDKQVEMGEKLLESLPDIDFHVVSGNHEERMKGSIHVGHDMLLSTAKSQPKFHYYGHVAKLTLNKEFSMTIMHSSGGSTYAKTYRPERIFDQLIERPNLLVTGHSHQLFVVARAANAWVTQAGCLQRENSFLLNKGIVPQVGYIILKSFSPSGAEFAIRRPEIF
jgi:hypothetical protein